MQKVFVLVTSAFLFVSCMSQDQNLLLSEFNTPFGAPPFDQIHTDHYLPAFEEGIEQERAEIQSITENPETPTFENTIEALEQTGALLTRVSNVFFNLTSAHTNSELQRISKEVAPLLARHRDDILLNEKLFARIKAVYEQHNRSGLSDEQKTLLDRYYKDFIRGGANLNEESKAEIRRINEELSVLSIQFDDNVLEENNRFELVLSNESELTGLPENVKAAAALTASERGHEGKWVFTLHKPSLIPFLQYADRRDLRETIFKAYIERGNRGDDLDNNKLVSRTAALRARKAKILGYPTHAHFVLEKNMARNPERVYDLLNQLWSPALKRAVSERAELQDLIRKEGSDFELQPWDWWYYAEKLRKEKYALDDESLRPYFELNNVQQGVFYVANQLYGLTFEERHDVPKYHPDVRVFEVKEADGNHVGILYTDYYPRETKQGGAWMNNFREQSRIDGEEIKPIVVNVFNFSRPVGDQPALLTFEEVSTMFHEFGHALHSLLSRCTYPKLSGTNVPRDFVELPSQIMENWAAEPEVLKVYARHYQSGSPIPQDLVDKIHQASLFNQGFATVEYLAASFLDLEWHSLTEPEELDVQTFEKQALDRIGLIPEIVVRYRSPYFSHIFAGGYSAGYYSYIWSEVLDADAFEAFKETSLFDSETAKAFRENILSKGGSEDPMVLYTRFRGAEPSIEPLLKKRGLL